MERELVALGRVAHLVTIGRLSGLQRDVAVGFVEEADGTILVAANSPHSAWGRNLLADPQVVVEVAGRRFEGTAEELDRAEHGRAVRELILRYGTPSEGLGSGPSFRLRPTPDEAAATPDAASPASGSSATSGADSPASDEAG
jgi:deazaflavin-dependent oxidoreductase (nitroreductase family)